MRGATRSRLLWCVVSAAAVLAVGALLVGCSKPQTAETAPPAGKSGPGAAGATKPAVPPTKPAEETSKPAETAKAQTAADPNNMTDAEKKHVPQFALPEGIKSGEALSVTVNIGQVPHPMQADHYIQWAELYLDGKLVKKIELKPGDKPEAMFEVTLTPGAHTLKADINCNIHGLWENTKEITAT